MEVFYLPVFVLVITTIITIFKDFDDYLNKVEKKGSIYKIMIPSIGLFLALVLTVVGEFSKYSNEIESANIRENQYQNIIGSAKESIDKANDNYKAIKENINLTNKNLVNSGKSLDALKFLKDSINISLSNLRKQINIQKEINAKSTELLIKNRELYEMVNMQADNSERQLNPIFPFHLYVSLEFNMEDISLRNLMDTIYKIKSKYEITENLIINNIDVYRVAETKREVKRISILNYDSVFKGVTGFDIFNDSYMFGFYIDSGSGLSNFNKLKSILSCKSYSRESNNNFSKKKYFNRLIFNFENRKIYFNQYLTYIEDRVLNEVQSKYFGIMDLEKTYFWFDTRINIKDVKVNGLDFYFGKNFNTSVKLYRLDSGIDTVSFYKDRYFFRRISNRDILKDYRTMFMDQFLIYYYDRGTESLGLPYPF